MRCASKAGRAVPSRSLLCCALPFFVMVAPPLPADPQGSGPALPPPPLQVQAAIDSAPHLSLDAQGLGLIDARLYRDQAVKLLGRLQEARQPAAETPATDPAASSKAGAPGAPEGLLPRLLAKPDAGWREGRGAPGMRGGQTEEGLACLCCASVRACLSLVGRQPVCAALFPRLPFQPTLIDCAANLIVASLLHAPRCPAEPARPLKHVSMRRYMLALAEQRRRREAEERREKLLARVSQLGSTTGWAQLLGRQQQAKEGTGSGEAGLEGSADGGVEGGSGAAATEPGRRPRVALLTLCGPIVLGPGSESAIPNPRGSPTQIASLPVIQALRRARLDPAVKAVVLRVDSPGGCPPLAGRRVWCGVVWWWAGVGRVQAGT